jgi:uncharacterized protein (DUF1800 family)
MSLDLARIAAHRFGLGPRPGELSEIAQDPRGWVKAQLQPETSPPPAIAALPAGADDMLAFARWVAQRRMRRGGDAEARMRERAAGADIEPAQLKMLSTEEDFARAFRQRVERAITARLTAGATTRAPVRERLVHFWGNHFTVSAAKPIAVALPPAFEREAIRPHVAGRFADMLLASSRHPGMLIYLDNAQSIGPNSAAAERRARRLDGPLAALRGRGLNENLAREILELHTLGVAGGYTQEDVTTFAKAITGWGVEPPGLAEILSDAPAMGPASGRYRFEARAHEPGTKTVLGKAYAQDGEAQGEAILRALARHPSTARFIATKLVRHYIADEPPAAVVARVEAAFRRTDGDLRAMMEALVDSPEAWASASVKFRRPEEYLIAALRAFAIDEIPPGAGPAALVTMGQRTYAAPGPDGWADNAAAWRSADLVWTRIEFASLLAERLARADIDPVRVAERTLGPGLAAETRQAIARAESPAQGLALFLASPDFQYR